LIFQKSSFESTQFYISSSVHPSCLANNQIPSISVATFYYPYSIPYLSPIVSILPQSFASNIAGFKSQ